MQGIVFRDPFPEGGMPHKAKSTPRFRFGIGAFFMPENPGGSEYNKADKRRPATWAARIPAVSGVRAGIPGEGGRYDVTAVCRLQRGITMQEKTCDPDGQKNNPGTPYFGSTGERRNV